MRQFRPQQKLAGPLVWGPDGREITPHVGGLVPAGSYRKVGSEFVTLPESQWVLLEGEGDDMGRKVPKTFDLEDIAGQMLAGWNIVKRRRVDLSNQMQRAVGGFVSVERFLELDGLYASLAEWGIEGLLNGGVALPESTMPADKVEAALLALHDHPDKIPQPTHPYLERMLTRMRVVEKWDALPKSN